ncbi:hypothetical protein LCGC14_0842280 [marine sediment metagenome]|uniref:BppU N-terminal domain-containing protein n=1 Tax=marine sediment metagenome TaxID=412755 RepID=A0A0F9PHG9_9ZZZZ
MYLGSWDIDDLLTWTVNAHDPTTGGVSDGDGVPTYRVYEDETGTPIITGSMALLDDANTVGFYSEQITLSAGNGLEYGKGYSIRVIVTVGGLDGVTIHCFQMRAKVDTRAIEGADPSDTIRDSVVDDATRIDASELNTLSGFAPGSTLAAAADVSTSESNIRGADSDTLKVLSEQLDGVQTDLDNPAQYKADVSALATAANQTTILARLGAWTGSGVNTILGAFKAVLSKVASLPSNIGGTGDPTTDSLEAIRERGDAEWVSADVSNVSVDELQASALADLFNTDSGDAYAAAVSGSVVKEIADNAGGSALTVSAIVDGVWDEATADHVSSGSFGLKLGSILAAIWAYVTRTLTSSAATTASTVAGTTLTITRGDTLTASITSLGSIAGRNKLWFTVKTDRGDADTAAIIQIEETLQLLRLNGAAPEVADVANGTITVDDEDNGDITIVLKAVETAKLTLTSGIRYDVQYFVTATGLVTTVTSGLLTVAADVTRATS